MILISNRQGDSVVRFLKKYSNACPPDDRRRARLLIRELQTKEKNTTMSTEILKKKETAVMAQPTQTAVNIFDPSQFDTLQRVCRLFASSDLVPDPYKASEKTPLERAIANCLIACEVASRTKASPLMVMQNMSVIYGRPSWSSKFLISTVNTCGRFNPLKFRFTEKGILGMVDFTEYNKTWVQGASGKGYYRNEAKASHFDGSQIMDIECVAYTTAKGSDDILESSPISIRMAIKEGWYTKAGSKWQTMPQQMLMYRAASFWTNAYAPELSMGMGTVEESQDISDVEYVDIPVATAAAAPVEVETTDNAAEQDNRSEAEIKAADAIKQAMQPKQPAEVVDTDTGEVLEPQAPAEQPQLDLSEQSPNTNIDK